MQEGGGGVWSLLQTTSQQLYQVPPPSFTESSFFFSSKCFDSKTSSKNGLTKSLQPVQRGCKQSNTPVGEQTGGGAR